MQPQQPQLNYEQILQNRIKYGNYCLITTISSMISACLDGVEVIIISIVVPVMQKDLQITKTDQTLITQSIFIGEILGSIIGGYLGDKYGRKPVLTLSNILCLLFGFLSSFSQSTTTFIIIRIFVAIAVGMIIVIANVQFNEICYKDSQQRNQILFCLSFSTGQLLLSLIAYFCFQSIDQGDWRLLIRLSNLIPLVCLPINYFQSESIKYQLEKLKFQQAFQTIDQAIKSNDPQAQPLTEPEKQQLISYYQNQTQLQKNNSYKPIFNHQYRSNTILISLQWFYSIQIYFATALFLPIQIAKQYSTDKSTSRLILIICGLPEIMASFCVYFTLNSRYVNGPQIYKLLFTLLLVLIAATFVIPYKAIMIAIIKMCIDQIIIFTLIYTAALYPTPIKARIFGFGSFCGRIGGLIMPFAMYYVIGSDLSLFLVLMFFYSLLFLYLSTLIDYDQNSNYCEFDNELTKP